MTALAGTGTGTGSTGTGRPAAGGAGPWPTGPAGRLVRREEVMGTVFTFDVRGLGDGSGAGAGVDLGAGAGTNPAAKTCGVTGKPASAPGADDAAGAAGAGDRAGAAGAGAAGAGAAGAGADGTGDWAGAAGADAAIDAAVAWLHWADRTFSTYKPASEVNRFDRGELGAGDCCAETRHIIALCHRFHGLTDGYFDAWATGHFDPSGIVKGWAVQETSLLLARAGFAHHLVDGGGDIVLSGCPGAGGRWKIGVKHPLQPNAYCASLSLDGGAVATSGTYERGHHVVNPRTGQGATALVAVTVTGPDLVHADAYATAALAMGTEAPYWLSRLDGYESQVISASGRGWWTPGFEHLSAG